MRRLLKTIPAVYSANSFVKDVALSLETAWIERSYRSRLGRLRDTLSDVDIRSMLQRRMREHGVRPLSRAESSLHIYFVGTYYDHEGFGFLQALQQLGSVSVYSDKNGKYGINSSSHIDGSAANEADNSFMVDQIRVLHSKRRIDFVIGTFVASSIAVQTLVAIRKMGIPVVNYAMDDRLPHHWRINQGVRMGAIGLVDGVDLTLQTTKEFVPRYLAEGCPCVYCPFASDPQIFSPGKKTEYDVVFVGNNYGKRSALVSAIQAAGVRVECYGKGFPNGHLPGDQVADILSRAKIILGTGLVGHSSSIVTLKLRDFDAPMSGAMYITSNNPDLIELYDIGSEIVTYSSVPDCIDKIKYYLAHDRARELVAASGRARAVRDHAWQQRLSMLLPLLEGGA